MRAGSDRRAGASLSRWRGLLWLLLFALLGWGLSGPVLLRPVPPRLLLASRAADGKIECYGGPSIDLAFVSRLDTEFAPGRMVLTVPVLDTRDARREASWTQVVIPAGARTVLVDEAGTVTVLAQRLPPPLLQALLGEAGATMAARVESSEAARAALRFLPALEEFLKRP